MKRIFTKVYAWALLIVLVMRLLILFALSWSNLDRMIEVVVGISTAIVLVPAFHELGHVLFAAINKMRIVYCKCFCMRYYVKNGKGKVGFVNPFTPDETQVLPTGGENMQSRAYAYAIGGLVSSGIIFLILAAACTLLFAVGAQNYTLYAWLAYAAYIFLLNVIPTEYASGKTDALVARGISKGEAVEQTMLNVMRIQGELQTGKTYAEIEEEYYFSAPQIAENEPMYVAILDARFSYYLEKEDYEKAFDCLKRIKAAGEYLTDEEVLCLEKNLAYLCLLGGNDEVLKTAAKNDEEYWKSEDVVIKRTLALYMHKCGEEERADLLISEARELLKQSISFGQAKHEELLLSRIK